MAEMSPEESRLRRCAANDGLFRPSPSERADIVAGAASSDSAESRPRRLTFCQPAALPHCGCPPGCIIKHALPGQNP